jgi:hypothetical protein
MRPANVLQAASGRWPEILVAIGGITPDQLCHREGPCPHCSAGEPDSTRFRWDSDAGDGEWFCSHCGGKDGRGGGGNGLDLLSRLLGHGWGRGAFVPTAERVAAWLGVDSPRSGHSSPRSGQGAPPPRTERACFDLLVLADQTADGEHYDTNKGKGRAYSRRWLRWSEAEENTLAVAEILAFTKARDIEQETADGVVFPVGLGSEVRPRSDVLGLHPGAEVPDPGQPTTPAAPPSPLTLEQASTEIRALVLAGTSRLALEQQLAALAARADVHPSQLRPLLSAIEAEQVAAAQVAAEQLRISAAAERSAVAAQMLSLSEILPPSLADAIRIRTQYLPIDPLAAAALFATTAAGVLKLGSRLVASRRCDFKVPLNMFSALVGRSGIKKSPAWSMLVSAPMAPIEDDLARQAARALRSWEDDNRGKKPSERTERPKTLRALCSEFTGEALSKQLAVQEQAGQPLAIAREEIGGLFDGLNQYKPGGRGSEEQQLLELYDGRGSSALRASSEEGGRFYSRSQVSITGTIQPRVLQDLVRQDRGSGLWARFLFLPVPDVVVRLPAEECEADALAMEAAAALLAHTIGDLYRLPPVTLELSDEARRQFVEYEFRCQNDARRSLLDTQCAAWSKAPGKALRVAGVLHLLHRVAVDGERSEQVTARVLQVAQNMVDSLTEWALGLHEAAEGGQAGGASDLMERVHKLAQRRGVPIAWGDVVSSLSPRARKEIDAGAAAAAVDALVALGVGKRTEAPRGGWRYEATGDLPG